MTDADASLERFAGRSPRSLLERSARQPLSVDDVLAARERTGARVRYTPVIALEPSALGLERADEPITLKLEQLQHTGSFKVRGAFNRILSHTVAGAGVVAASGGNHGMATAYAARSVGLRAEVFVPAAAPPVKVVAIRELGATATLIGASYAEAYDAAEERQRTSGALLVHAYEQPEVVAGQGTVGLEIAEQAPDLDTLLVAVGGGGLMAGIATALAGRVRVVAVEPDTIPTLHRALAMGEPVDVPVGGVAADSLGARRIGLLGFQVARRLGVSSVLVSDQEVLRARRLLWTAVRLAVEPGGAVALAALTSGAYRPAPAERIGVLLCGANTDPSDLVATPQGLLAPSQGRASLGPSTTDRPTVA